MNNKMNENNTNTSGHIEPSNSNNLSQPMFSTSTSSTQESNVRRAFPSLSHQQINSVQHQSSNILSHRNTPQFNRMMHISEFANYASHQVPIIGAPRSMGSAGMQSLKYSSLAQHHAMVRGPRNNISTKRKFGVYELSNNMDNELPPNVVSTNYKKKNKLSVPTVMRFGVKLKFRRKQLRIGSSYCDKESAGRVAAAFKRVARFDNDSKKIYFDPTELMKILEENNEVSMFERWKKTKKIKLSIHTILVDWLQNRQRGSLPENKEGIGNSSKSISVDKKSVLEPPSSISILSVFDKQKQEAAREVTQSSEEVDEFEIEHVRPLPNYTRRVWPGTLELLNLTLARCFGMLDGSEVIHSIPLVSRRWRARARKRPLWVRICMRDVSFTRRAEEKGFIEMCGGFLKFWAIQNTMAYLRRTEKKNIVSRKNNGNSITYNV